MANGCAAHRLAHLQQILRCGPSLLQVQLRGCRAVSTSVNVKVTPKDSLYDQKVRIQVQGLPSKAKVTLHLATKQERKQSPLVFAACSHHSATEMGEVDLNINPSVGGSFTGLDPMGLFWSMQPSPAGPQNVRKVLKDMEKPVLYTLSVYSGHLSLGELHRDETASEASAPQPPSQEALVSAPIHRTFMADGVRRIPIREGNIRGTLFLPPGDGPFQGVIDLFGLAGGLMEIRGALLANHGFATLSLAYFAYDDLPKHFNLVPFDYFEEVADWFSLHPNVRKGGVGVLGTSGGALFGMMMAWKLPQVTAFVRINGPTWNFFGDVYWKGELFQKKLPIGRPEQMKDHGEGYEGREFLQDVPEYILPTWESSTPILTISCKDDGQLNATNADIHRDMYPEDRRHLIQVVHYPGAGHLLEPPYTPHCRASYNPPFGKDMLWGGNVKEHAAAQQDCWQKIQEFFRSYLPQ